MATFITGDTHGKHDVGKLDKLNDLLTEDDNLIVLGDFGVCWNGRKVDKKVRYFWKQKNCNVLFVDGNHENFCLLNAYDTSDFSGGKVHRVGEKITHLMRGQVYEIDGKTFITMGGAASNDCGAALEEYIAENIDRYHTLNWRDVYENWNRKLYPCCRAPGKSWWAEEIPSPEEIAEAKANLAAVGNKVDYILTHTASSRIYRHLGFSPKERFWGAGLIDFFDWLEENVEFEHWWFGHLHRDFVYDERHTGFYEAIRAVE